jgi:hypothetical protein
MLADLPYHMFANVVLALHFAIVVFVVFGLVLIIFGNLFGWCWVNAPWFRIVHLSAIVIVVAEVWLGITCPLTTLEVWLRSKAGAEPYRINFIEYWLQRLLFYDAPPWAFIVGYSVFCLLVIAAWWNFPPRSKKHTSEDRS